MESAALNEELGRERQRVLELTALVQQEQKKVSACAACCAPGKMRAHESTARSQVERIRSTQQTLETNMSRLFETAKGQMEERGQHLTAARLELQQARATMPSRR